MAEQERADSLFPEGWMSAIIEKADLEKSFNALAGIAHFFVETMRGRIRWYQLRTEDAWEHFNKAEKLAEDAPETTLNLSCMFKLQVFRFDNAILETLAESGGEMVDISALPNFPDALLQEFPELRMLLKIRQRVQAAYCLIADNFSQAAGLFDKLINSPEIRNLGEFYAHCCMGKACALYNIGDGHTVVAKTLEAAGLALSAGTKTLFQARETGILSGLYQYLGEKDKAEEWRDFLNGLPCPQATKSGFLELTKHVTTCCEMRNRMIIP